MHMTTKQPLQRFQYFDGSSHTDLNILMQLKWLPPGIGTELDTNDVMILNLYFRLVNSDSQAFIKRFQPEISRQVSPVLKNYVNMWVDYI